MKEIKPKLNGCLNCSSIPDAYLELSEVVDFDTYGGLHMVRLIIGDNNYRKGSGFYGVENEMTLEKFISYYKRDIEICDVFCIEFESALHGEVYQYDKENKRFFLIEQIQGWA